MLLHARGSMGGDANVPISREIEGATSLEDTGSQTTFKQARDRTLEFPESGDSTTVLDTDHYDGCHPFWHPHENPLYDKMEGTGFSTASSDSGMFFAEYVPCFSQTLKVQLLTCL